MPSPRQSDPVLNLDNIRPTAAKAVLSSDRRSVGGVFKSAVVKHYGSVKAAAISLGNVDPSLMMREFAASKFGRFDEHADDAAKADVSAIVYRALGQSDPKAEIRRALKEAKDRIEDVMERIS